jgi:predicted ester cyclase
MASVNESVLRRWFDEVWNRGNVDAADELMAPGGVLHGAAVGGESSLGLDEFKVQVRMVRGAIPDIRFDVVLFFEAGEHAAARLDVTGTLSGRGLGIEPTGRSFRITGIAIGRFRDGRVIEGWNNFDLLSLFEQVTDLVRPAAGQRAY